MSLSYPKTLYCKFLTTEFATRIPMRRFPSNARASIDSIAQHSPAFPGNRSAWKIHRPQIFHPNHLPWTQLQPNTMYVVVRKTFAVDSTNPDFTKRWHTTGTWFSYIFLCHLPWMVGFCGVQPSFVLRKSWGLGLWGPMVLCGVRSTQIERWYFTMPRFDI